ncbi:MAG: Lrp/AsnC family transcriptional regulator [Chloroflexi bacterium]|nr:Lrp/AsnC family transcriptional regulator [Chloroflexota bacterium]MDA1228685.1 Lrp/AsnC family transcriptional regulator [Chloroflexota bacterium]
MDKLDIRIISLLQDDGTATNAGIARQVGVSEETVRRRLKRLVQEEYIKVVALPDPVKLGYESEVLIGVQVDADKVDAVSDALANMDEINWVSITTGSFDIFAWATLKSSEELSVFLRTKVGVTPGVRRLETFVNLAIKKRRYGVAI